jgi:integrase
MTRSGAVFSSTPNSSPWRDACPDYFKPVVTFAYYTGWRKEEILSLRCSQIDLPAEEIRLEVGTDKNAAGRGSAMDGELLETIKSQWGRRKVVQIPGYSPTLLCQHVFHCNGKVIPESAEISVAFGTTHV